ncbi:hypothetical protein EDB81DRAFT_750857 [Dactylonectria macrodidyma]|uniref:Uncharacterized protein n=1 Tax=Dactylonectria macrodidyma TaxID=307937 RepID=A0A9P9JML9_9HYPO|nr:hypothetical protein EDB81DRAFT_750857 [Dactylonectria macrodidyma]
MLRTTSDTIDSLRRVVEKPQSRLARSTQRLTWHWKKDDVAKHLARIERVKAWFLIAMRNDSLKLQEERHLIESFSSSNSKILLQMRALSLSIEQDRDSKTSELKEMKQTTLLQHLAPIGPDTTHSKALSNHQPGTPNWFTTGPLQRFFDSDGKCGAILWLKGKSNDPTSAGSGKTTLLESKGQDSGFSAMELEDVFIKHASAASSIYLFIDAINESELSIELESLLYRLASGCPTMRTIVSSTADRTLNTNSSVVLLDAEMNVHDVNDDIQVYIDGKLKTNKMLGVLSERLKQEIRDFVLGRSNGMFRYARCQMDYLAFQRTGRGVRRALSDMPSNLNETYERALKNIKNSEDRQLELADAIVVEKDDDGIDEDIRLHDPKILIENSNGLLDFNPVTQTVSLAHSSIKTFLTSDWIRSSSASEFALEFSGGCGTINERTIYRYPFLNYAAWNWPHHLHNPSSDDWHVISAFLSARALERGGNYGSWIHTLVGSISPDIVTGTHPLYYAASFGFTPLVEAILLFDDSADLEAPGGRVGSTALQVACFRR